MATGKDPTTARQGPTRARKDVKRSALEEDAHYLLVGREHLPEPELHYQFALPERRWEFDFCWPEPYRVALEVEGGQWLQTAGKKSRHFTPKGYEGDCEKYSEAAIRGWLVVRTTTDMLYDGRATALARRALLARGWTPARAA